jgi:hypothetical protein
MEIISLGGVGGCQLAQVLRKYNYSAYPYDWLITNQSFVIDSFDSFDNFFVFDEFHVYRSNYLLDKWKRAIMLHDFVDFNSEKDKIIEKYRRRFERLHHALTNNKKLLFVRIMENIDEKLHPLEFYDSIYVREEEDIHQWEQLIQTIIDTYKCSCHLLLISNEVKYISSPSYKNITIAYTENKEADSIYRIIDEIIHKE